MSRIKEIRMLTFLPPFIVLLVFLVMSFIGVDSLMLILSTAYDWIRANLAWAASILTLMIALTVWFAPFSKLGNIRLGGKDAKPEMKTFSWFTIVLTTTIASGILFWGPAAPIDYFTNPPTELYGIEAGTPQALKFAMEAMFLHWTFVPYAIYTLPAVVFAFMYYNGKKPFSIVNQIAPFIGKKAYTPRVMQIVDSITLFSIGAGMSSTVGMTILNISTGISTLTGIEVTNSLLMIVAAVIGLVVVGTAISGIQKGMQLAANINVYGYIVFLLFILAFSNPQFLVGITTEAFGGFVGSFFDRMLMTGTAADSGWTSTWTTFHWFAWMAWAPTIGAFLGKIAYGRTIKQMIAMYGGVCACASGFWIVIISGTTLWLQKSGATDFTSALAVSNQDVSYELIRQFPFSDAVTVLFVVLLFLSVVTACNSNVISMSSISTAGLSAEKSDPPAFLKIVWGIVVLAFSCMSLIIFGTDSIRILANFAGLFSSLIMVGALISLIKIIRNPEKYDATAEDFQDTVFVPMEDGE